VDMSEPAVAEVEAACAATVPVATGGLPAEPRQLRNGFIVGGKDLKSQAQATDGEIF
jgi:hypothetical protein